MVENQNINLSHVAFAILGLVAEQPSHGKDLNKKIEDRGMRNWTAIGKSSIYGVLQTLKKKGLVDSWLEEEDNRLVKVYKITDKGSTILKSQTYRILKEYYGRDDEDFYVAFSQLPLLSLEEQKEAFTSSIKKMKVHIKELKDMIVPNMPINVRGLFIHPIKIMETDIAFLEDMLSEIRKEEK